MRCSRLLRCPTTSSSMLGAVGIPQPTGISAKVCINNNWDRLKGIHDICYFYPRYAVETNLPDSLPELISAKKTLYEGENSGDSHEQIRTRVRSHLFRAYDVFNSACAGSPDGILADSGAAPAVRKFYVAVAGAIGATEKPTSNKYQDFRLCVNLAPAVRAIAKDTAIHAKNDSGSFDAACMVVSSYTRAMTNQLMRGEWHSVQTLADSTGISIPATCNVANFLPTPGEVLSAVESLQLSCMNLARSEPDEQGAISYRSTYNKLVGLGALLQIEHNNDASAAIDMITPLFRLKGSNEIEKHMIDGLKVELMRRAYGFAWGKDAVDSEVEAAYHRSQDFFTQYFRPDTPEGAVEMDPTKRVMLRDSYSMYLLSMSTMYSEIPHLDTAEQSWTPAMRERGIALSPYVNVPCAELDQSKVVRLKTTGTCIPCAARRGKKLATAYADRAMRINRKIFPERRNNTRAAASLRQLAICFTDVRDYLYASGMFNSTARTYEEIYGRVSEEHLEVLEKAQYMQDLLKNDKEAAATKNKIGEIKAEFDEKARKHAD